MRAGRKGLVGYQEWRWKLDSGARARGGDSNRTPGWRWESGDGKDWSSEIRCRISRQGLWEQQNILGGMKNSFRKTDKCQTEANGKVWSLNKETEEHRPDLDKMFDKEFEVMEESIQKGREGSEMAYFAMNAASGTREHRCQLAASFDEAEVTLTTAIGKEDSMENDQDYLRKVLFLWNKIEATNL